ncbi:hypothetical protein [Escherichia coli]|uniref:hypothetical protein n=1 Tax=Escherichia coli TaxID=562 RepID=UPI0018522A32|nr:hypothetical protein [Escherichia coli]WHH35754.1 hypothetical protein QDX30_17005 [Escherichia coli]WHH62587.1 hypothetical protein QDW57_17045 [Escherichia coli]WHH67355.1 hypothetical protein QDW56_17050 [Escherichia coli]HAG5884041.1 hypothetical protein [Escherichia coli]
MDESRKQFEEYVAKKLRLPFEMITEARNGDRYFAFSSMDKPSGLQTAISGGASGAMTGAALGSIVPGLGTGLGAAIGGGLGLLGSLF